MRALLLNAYLRLGRCDLRNSRMLIRKGCGMVEAPGDHRIAFDGRFMMKDGKIGGGDGGVLVCLYRRLRMN